jgi:hypothetical protein
LLPPLVTTHEKALTLQKNIQPSIFSNWAVSSVVINMKIPSITQLSLFLAVMSLTCHFTTVRSYMVLSENLMNLTREAARLSILASEEEPPTDTVTHVYEAFGYFDDDPDQALTLKTIDGYCFVAFRGSSLELDDWAQNIEIGNANVCTSVMSPTGNETCCTSRVGFYNAYNTQYRTDIEQNVRDCASTCPNRDDCVVLTGHSRGGSEATIAAIILADLNPIVITFGQPPTINTPCELLTSERIYRFVNTKVTDLGIAYDPVPMAPGLGADHFGNMIILSDDSTGVALIGLDANEYFHPFFNGVDAHYMRGDTASPGYADRIDSLMGPDATYPIRTNVSNFYIHIISLNMRLCLWWSSSFTSFVLKSVAFVQLERCQLTYEFVTKSLLCNIWHLFVKGFAPGNLCSSDTECESKQCDQEVWTSWKRCVATHCNSDDDCATGRCDSGQCLTKATSCMPCDEDSDCDGDDSMCLFFLCSNEFGKMDNNCFCRIGSDCDSGRCEGWSFSPMCEARLANGASCNEHSDCISDYCSWSFVCEPVE